MKGVGVWNQFCIPEFMNEWSFVVFSWSCVQSVESSVVRVWENLVDVGKILRAFLCLLRESLVGSLKFVVVLIIFSRRIAVVNCLICWKFFRLMVIYLQLIELVFSCSYSIVFFVYNSSVWWWNICSWSSRFSVAAIVWEKWPVVMYE